MPKRRPNILLICADQLRPDVFGYAGNPHIQTPHFNEIARAGVNFCNAFSETPACIPARKILMTGQNAYQTGQFNNYPAKTAYTNAGPFMAECFGQAGYQTQAVGKMHVSPSRFRVGFDNVLLDNESGRSCDMRLDDYEAYLADKGLLDRLNEHSMPANGYHSRPATLPEEHCHDAWTAREAARFLERRDPTAPFFLYASFRNPHPPLAPPQFYWDLYKDKKVHQAAQGDWLAHEPALLQRQRVSMDYELFSEEEIRQAIRAYYGLVTSIDHQIGNLMAALGAYGQLGETLVMVIADHGEMLFDHGAFHKAKFYRTAAGIPFLIMPPSHQDHGIVTNRRLNDPVMLQDVMPTLLDFCGIDIPVSCTGRSLLPALRGEEKRVRDYGFGVHYEDGGGSPDGARYCIQDHHHRYLYYVEGGVEQLFDLNEDYYDCHDLSRDLEHRTVNQGSMRDSMPTRASMRHHSRQPVSQRAWNRWRAWRSSSRRR
jgi:arylsulfatase